MNIKTLNIVRLELKKAFIDNKYPLLISTIIFIVSLVIGYIFSSSLNSVFNPIINELINDLESGVITLSFHHIFLNNISILLSMYILGTIFCFSSFILIFNGMFLGYFIGNRANTIETILLILPHGIFELSSCVIGTAAGFVLFIFIFRIVKSIIPSKLNDNLTLKDRLYKAINENFYKLKQSLILLGVSIFLMVIAGLIEVYVTIGLSNWILSII